MHFGNSTGRSFVPGVYAHSVNRLQEKRNHMGQQKSAKKISMQHFLAASLGRVFGAGIARLQNLQCNASAWILLQVTQHSVIACWAATHMLFFLLHWTITTRHPYMSFMHAIGRHDFMDMKTATKHYKFTVIPLPFGTISLLFLLAWLDRFSGSFFSEE
jgi:hypothetical protein